MRKPVFLAREHLSKLDRFLTFLKTTVEAGQPMLDHTMVTYGSDMNSGAKGEHSPKNLPLIVASGKACGLKHGQHIANDPAPPLSNVFLSVAQKMGVKSPNFSDSTGDFTEISNLNRTQEPNFLFLPLPSSSFRVFRAFRGSKLFPIIQATKNLIRVHPRLLYPWAHPWFLFPQPKSWIRKIRGSSLFPKSQAHP